LLQNSKTLPDQVKRVLAVKYADKPFSQLSEIEKEAHSIALLLKINVVTGWPVPESDEETNILAEQLKLYLVENWENYNVDEIMYAIRGYATVLNNWGKNMNLSLIGKALSDYEHERSDVSAMEATQQPLTTNLLTMQADWKELCEMYYQDYLNNKFHLTVMPYQLYDEFVSCKMMAEDAYEDYLEESQTNICMALKIEIAENINENAKHQIQQSIDKIMNGEDEFKVINYAKKLAVQFLYKTAKEIGFINLFIKCQ
jgi:hypothetical protein